MIYERSELGKYKFLGRRPQNLMGPKALYKPPARTSRSPAEGELTASIYIYIYVYIYTYVYIYIYLYGQFFERVLLEVSFKNELSSSFCPSTY